MTTTSAAAGHLRLLPETPITTLQAHLDAGGGRGLDVALQTDPDRIIDLVDAAGLRGRGGAGFPTGGKWRSIVQTAREDDLVVSLVVNGAEGEPGTYKDRALLLTNPYLVLEGLLIACHAVGARRAFVGIKASFDGPRRRLEEALAAAVAAGWPCAETVEIVAGPDEYLFGEEKAMLEVIEGNLPLPRHLAPYMNGLFTQSSNPSLALVNNVETLANVPRILADGPEWFRQVGTDAAPGTMLFTVTGDVANPGVYELPLGTPLGVLLTEIAGAKDIQFAVSGVSSAIITPRMLDTPMDYESMTAAGTGLGSGGYVVYDSTRCVVQVAATLARFLAVESCGQCNACSLGTGAISEILDQLVTGDADEVQLEAMAGWATRVTDLARCGLPTGAQLLITSLLVEYEDHLTRHLTDSCAPPTERLEVPKIDHLDLDTGEVTYDPTYHLKRSDWTYADG